VLVRAGDTVQRGQTLAVIEAMKLELQVSADRDGVVAAVHVQRGDQVKARKVLVELRAISESRGAQADGGARATPQQSAASAARPPEPPPGDAT
jgi:pyruvate/2-oxoglutarate dehydrogenase complex dihydrolipoamide acyltransferase (E2) component